MDINHYYLLGFLQKLNKHDTRESTRHWVVAEYLVLLALTSCENFGSFNGSLNSPRKGPWKATEKHYTRLLPCLGQCQWGPQNKLKAQPCFNYTMNLPLLFGHFKSECSTNIHCISSKRMHVNQGRLPTVTTAKHQKFNVRKPQSCSCYRVKLQVGLFVFFIVCVY